MRRAETFVVLGAGVIGLTTALEIKQRFPADRVIVVAKHLPGDRDKVYTSPWAGANWLSLASDNGPEEERDAITFRKFAQLVREGHADAGIFPMDICTMFDQPPERSGVLSKDTNRIWYENLVPGGIRYLPKEKLPGSVNWACEFSTFVIDTQRYLPWLQALCLKKGVEVRRGTYSSLSELFDTFPGAKAYFNCTGLGSYSLGGVKDNLMYPSRGQVLLVESPKKPIEKMYVHSPLRANDDTTYIFPRGRHGGIILGGCRQDNNWDGEVDYELAEDIKRRCCAVCPELGRPEDLKIISHGVGLRPTRKGGARIEKEILSGATVVHCYGAGGAGYQSSWGAAKEAVDLIHSAAKL